MFTKTLSATARCSLAVLGKSGLIEETYLAGGSALALHLGHRQSIDFDFFTSKHFDNKNLARIILKCSNCQARRYWGDEVSRHC